MSRFTTFLSREHIQVSLRKIISRFPIPTAIVCIFTFLLFYFIYHESHSSSIIKSVFSLIATFFFSTGATLYIENRSKGKMNVLFHLFPLLYGILLYCTLNIGDDWMLESIVYFALHLSGFIAFLFFAPYIDRLFKNEEDISYTNYFSLVSWNLLMSTIVGLSLLILGFIAIGSVFALFDIGDLVQQEKIFAYWAVVSLAFSAPIYGLLHFPMKSEINARTFEVNKFFSFLIKYIGVPFITIYFIILYAYTTKVLINFSDWPKGMISWMVIGFSVFGYLNYIFSKSYEVGNSFIRIFRRYFPMIVVPQLGMLFYAIYLRIAQYDFTMNRYFVVIFGVWLVIISLYLVISKKKSLSLIPASLALIAFVISIGPWSVFRYPLDRQYNKLLSNLETAHILQGGIISPLKSPKDISKELSSDIYSEIAYVCDFSECSLIKNLFKKELAEAVVEGEKNWQKHPNLKNEISYPGLSKWEIINVVAKAIKVEMSYSYDSTREDDQYLSYSVSNTHEDPYPIALDGGYTRLVKVYGEDDIMMYGNLKYPYVTINSDSQVVTYHRGSGSVLNLSMSSSEKLLDPITPYELEQNDLMFSAEGKGISMKLFLQNYAVKNPKYREGSGDTYSRYQSINGIALVKD